MTTIVSTLRDGAQKSSLIEKFDADRGVLVLRGIEAGVGIDIDVVDADGVIGPTTNQKKIVISSSIPPVITGESNTASNRGSAGEGLFFQKSGADLEFKRLLAGENVLLTSDNESVTISAAASGEVNVGTNIGTGFGLYSGKYNTELQFRSLKAGGGVNIYEDDGALVIENIIVPGETNTVSNVGTGVGLFKEKAGVDLKFKSLQAGQNVNLVSIGDTITIDVDIPATAVTKFVHLTDVPDDYTGAEGTVLSVRATGNGLEFMALAPVAKTGAYGDLTGKPDFADVAFSGNYEELINKPDIPTIPTIPSVLNDLANVAANPTDGQVLTWNELASKWEARALSTTGNMRVSDDVAPVLGGDLDVNGKKITSSTAIVLDAPVLQFAGISFPNTDGLPGQVLKTDGAGTLGWADDAVGVSGSGEANTVTNLGTGTGLFKQKDGVDLQFKSITGSSKLSIVDGDTVALDVVEESLDINHLGGGPLSISKGGTGATDVTSLVSNLGLGNMAQQNANAVVITGGTLNGVVIGGSAPEVINATDLTASGAINLNGIAFPTVDGNSGQVLTTDGFGHLVWSSLSGMVKASNILYVAVNGNDTTGDGGLAKPYATINKALGAAIANTVVLVMPGTYNESLTFPTLTGLALIGYGAYTSSRVIINGKISCTGLTDTVISNIKVVNTDVCLQLTNPGTTTITNCLFVRTVNTDAVRLDGAVDGIVLIKDTFVVGSVVNAHSGSGTGMLVIQGANNPDMQVQNLTGNASTLIENCTTIGWVRHDAGVMNLRSIGCIIKDSSGYSIQSSASQSTHVLNIDGVSLRQPDGTFGRINKLSNSPYSVTDTSRDPLVDSLSGTRSFYGRSSHDIAAGYIPNNYIPSNESLRSHLQAIDGKLINAGVTTLSTDVAPQLGADLDVNGKAITSQSGDIVINPATNLVVDSPLALSNGNFAVYGDARTVMYVLRGQSSGAAPAELYLDGSGARMQVPVDTTWMAKSYIVARRTDVDDESAAFEITVCLDNNTGTTAIVGVQSKQIFARDKTTWDVNFQPDNTSDTLKVFVTGEASKSIRWVAYVTVVEVKG